MLREERRVKMALYHGVEFILEYDEKLAKAIYDSYNHTFKLTTGKQSGNTFDADLILEKFKMVLIPLSKIEPADLNKFAGSSDGTTKSLVEQMIKVVTTLAKEKYDIFNFIGLGEAKEM